jgi:hypothetical protein
MSTQAACNGEREPKGVRKRVEKRSSSRGFHSSPFWHPFSRPFFLFPAELQVGPRFCWSSTIFVLLIEKGGKTGQKTKRMAKRAKKGEKKGGKKGNCEQLYCPTEPEIFNYELVDPCDVMQLFLEPLILDAAQ